MTQIELYLPPPITAQQAAAILGKFGGEQRQRNWVEKRNAKTRQIREELKMPPHKGLMR